MTEPLVVAGQIWNTNNGSDYMVYGLKAAELDHCWAADEGVYADVILYHEGKLVGHTRITCDRLREEATLVYDPTMKMPWRI